MIILYSYKVISDIFSNLKDNMFKVYMQIKTHSKDYNLESIIIDKI